MEVMLKVKGAQELQQALQRLGPKARDAVAKALYQEAESIMTRSKDGFVPVDVGNLKDSGHVRPPEINDNEVKVVMGYGGPAAPYAIYVHEDLDAHHEHGQAKYLEQPVNEAMNGMPQRIAAKLRAEVR